MKGVEALGQNLIEGKERAGIVSHKEVLYQREREFVIQHIEVTDYVFIFSVLAAEGHRLVKDGESVTHGTIGLGGNDMERLVVNVDSFFGRNALETLVARLENDRGKFVCIAAGYTYEMEAFISENSGFESRFPTRNRITFEDYNPDELFQIFMIHARKGGYTLDPMAENAVRGKLTMLYNNRGRTFGNGRDARNLFDEVKSNLAARLAEEGGVHSPEERKTIMMEDVL